MKAVLSSLRLRPRITTGEAKNAGTPSRTKVAAQGHRLVKESKEGGRERERRTDRGREKQWAERERGHTLEGVKAELRTRGRPQDEVQLESVELSVEFTRKTANRLAACQSDFIVDGDPSRLRCNAGPPASETGSWVMGTNSHILASRGPFRTAPLDDLAMNRENMKVSHAQVAFRVRFEIIFEVLQMGGNLSGRMNLMPRRFFFFFRFCEFCLSSGRKASMSSGSGFAMPDVTWTSACKGTGQRPGTQPGTIPKTSRLCSVSGTETGDTSNGDWIRCPKFDRILCLVLLSLDAEPSTVFKTQVFTSVRGGGGAR